MKDQKPYRQFSRPQPLTDDTPVFTSAFPGMTVKKWSDLLAKNFERSLEKGNDILRQLDIKGKKLQDK
jgi:hypothetical protein